MRRPGGEIMIDVDRDRVLAFRAAQQGLAEQTPRSLAEAAASPASDFQRGSALLALAARTTEISREQYDRATDVGEVAVGHSLRGAIHAMAPGDLALFGRALIADEPGELQEQLGKQLKAQLEEHSIDPRDALDEVTEATARALNERGRLDKNDLHEELRAHVRNELLPWCPGCKSHHVAPMLWRYALARVGARRDSKRRYLLGEPSPTPPPAEAVRRFLHYYGPATVDKLQAWAGLGRKHARGLWQEIERELVEVKLDGGRAWLLAEDRELLESPPAVRGLLLLPPGDPYLQKPNRPALVPDVDLRKRVFRSVASPGIVLQDGEVAGLWRARARGKQLEIDVEQLASIDRAAFEAEADRVAELRDAEAAIVRGQLT
jgi:Winged helix DNA-binding domain